MSNKELYPLKFTPILKSTIWGGRKLNTLLNKPSLGDDLVGESWEISGVKDNVSVVADGELKGSTLTELIHRYKGDLVGRSVFEKFAEEFPLLIKFIDARQDLSIQVHPDDVLAKERHNSFGKTEMWYVVDAEAGATLISGFKKGTNRTEYLSYFKSGRLMELLNREQVERDDVYYLPAGRVHTIGKGLLIAEIQQTSDITYRIYDFERVDNNGNPRQLHVEEALDAIDFNFYNNYKTLYSKEEEQVTLATSQYFVVNRVLVNKPFTKDYKPIDSFVVLMFLEGSGTIQYSGGFVSYVKGETILIPALMDEIELIPDSPTKLMEIYLPS